MDALQDMFLSLSSLSHVELMLGLLITATVIVALEDWRLGLWALLAQYVLVGLLLVRVMPMQVALVKVIVGGLVCLILYLTARRVHWGREATIEEGSREATPVPVIRGVFSMNLAFRLFVALLAALVTYALGSRYPFVEQPLGISEACYWLVAMGLLATMVTTGPFRVGLGLLTFVAGFEVLFATLEKSLSVAALLGVVNFLIALAIAYITTAQLAALSEEGRR